MEAEQLGCENDAVCRQATHTLVARDSSSAQCLQWQRVRQVTMDVFFHGCFVFIATENCHFMLKIHLEGYTHGILQVAPCYHVNGHDNGGV